MADEGVWDSAIKRQVCDLLHRTFLEWNLRTEFAAHVLVPYRSIIAYHFSEVYKKITRSQNIIER